MPDPSPDPYPPWGPPTLAVVIPATDNPATLERCLAALEAGICQPDELIVQREPAGAGPAAARNLGIAASCADVIVFVDSDVEVHADALARIRERFHTDIGLAALFGAYDDDPGDPGLTSRYRNLLHHHVHSSAAGEAETFWAGLGAVRREAFEIAGDFNAVEYPQASIEDIEWGMRMRHHCGKIILDPWISGRHLKRWTPLSMIKTDFSRRGVPWVRLLLRKETDTWVLNLGRRQRLSAAISVALFASLLARRPRLAAAALIANLLLERDLYGLLARRGGPRLLLAGIGLHQLHQLTAAASLPAALVLHLREQRS